MICDICEAVGYGVAMIMAMAITVAVEHVLDCSEKRYGGWIGGWVPVLIKKEKELKRKIYNLNIRLLRNVQDAGGSCFLLIKNIRIISISISDVAFSLWNNFFTCSTCFFTALLKAAIVSAMQCKLLVSLPQLT